MGNQNIAIDVEGLGKRYLLGHQSVQTQRYTALRDVASNYAKNIVQKVVNTVRGRQTVPGDSIEEFWALKDVSFQIKKGEVIGIVGRNGAGKSTLLKILSRITEPSEGCIRLEGRVASLLEVGTGFHPELTGRENIFLNGAILGMKRREIKAKFDEIVDFAEVERFLDTPVKRYSSGMYVRLAFAVAAHLEPEILIVDEVLAVGDAGFQEKCLGKIKGVSEQEGRTVLFVSHNMQAVSRLCSRAILLKGGRVEREGDVQKIIAEYSSNLLVMSKDCERVWPNSDEAPGNNAIRIQRVAIIPEDVAPDSPIGMTTPFRLEVDYQNLVPDTSIILNLSIYSVDGSPVLQTLTTNEARWHGKAFPKSSFRSVCHFPGNFFNQGSYKIRILFVNAQMEHLFDFSEAMFLSVLDLAPRNIPWYGRYVGSVHPSFEWSTREIEGAVSGESALLLSNASAT